MAILGYQRPALWQMGLLIFTLMPQLQGSHITVSNGGAWGYWEDVKMCPTGFYAYGFSLRVERSQRDGDDTALNGIRLLCKHETYPISEVVAETTGFWGHWTAERRCGSGRLDSFQLRVEPSQGRGDDTAANNINFHCTNGDTLHGDGMSWGGWSTMSTACQNGICGLQAKMEGPQGRGDDTALNDVRMICC